MDRRALAILVCLPFAAGAQERAGQSDPGAPVHVAAMLGVVSLPRPVDAEVLVRIADLFGVGIGYSDFPAFIGIAIARVVSAELQLPRFRDQIVAAPALMPLRPRQLEPGVLVDAPRRLQLALRPKHQLLVAALPREADAFVDQTLSDSQTARSGLDQQQSQLGDALRAAHQEHRPDALAVLLGDPAAL